MARAPRARPPCSPSPIPPRAAYDTWSAFGAEVPLSLGPADGEVREGEEAGTGRGAPRAAAPSTAPPLPPTLLLLQVCMTYVPYLSAVQLFAKEGARCGDWRWGGGREARARAPASAAPRTRRVSRRGSDGDGLTLSRGLARAPGDHGAPAALGAPFRRSRPARARPAPTLGRMDL